MSSFSQAPSFSFSFHSNPQDDSESNDEDDDRHRSGSRARLSGACVHCKSLKVLSVWRLCDRSYNGSIQVKCEYLPGESNCQRCLAGSHKCVVRGRKKRKPAPYAATLCAYRDMTNDTPPTFASTHDDLQRRSNMQDGEIQMLLERLDNMRADEKIRQWLSKSEHGIRDSRPQSSDYQGMGLSPAPFQCDQGDYQLLEYLRGRFSSKLGPLTGSPSDAYTNKEKFFCKRDPDPEPTPPDIVRYGVLTPDDIVLLFRIFFDRINIFFSLLDPEIHTPSKLIWASPFLFTVICALGSRFYSQRPNLYPLAMEFARDAAGKALVDGSKSVDICQAYLLMAVYPMPGKNWNNDRSWILMGVAIRMAIELALHKPPPSDCDEREVANRIRTWLNCFCVDGAHATSFGKLSMTPTDDIVSRTSRDWHISSRFNLPFDIHLVAYVDILLIMEQFQNEIGRNHLPERTAKGFDIVATCIDYDDRLATMMDFWVQRYTNDPNNCDPMCNYRGNNTQMISAYLRLVVLATAFPYAVKTGLVRDSRIVRESIIVACKSIKIMTDKLYPTGILRYAMEANFLCVSFAAAFLINLLRPKFLPLLDETTQRTIIKVVRELIDVLGSKEVAFDGRHSPALYSRFLSSLLNKYDQGTSPKEGMEFVPQFKADRQQTPPNTYYWPDTPAILGPSIGMADAGFGQVEGAIYQQAGDADMDFSMQHFMNAMTAHGQQNPQTVGVPAMPASSSGFVDWTNPYQATPAMCMDDHLWPLDHTPQYGPT
ncbi:hypothetical protein EVG20_g4425 [Dentipellis fragilis]|uniref:Xylanolytic transcriptional activator regulatory domain-containing protein n=1 Tax=Dentipellis fragilis TaxID=205917 RepID=A0A4Y9YY29_9AGAM|nr:hypothetical protein EVG20_g4425 [Dentipellis fragilis]